MRAAPVVRCNLSMDGTGRREKLASARRRETASFWRYFAVHNITWRALPRRFGHWKICDRLCEAEDPPYASVALKVRIAALRQALLLTTKTPVVAELVPMHADAVPRQEIPTTAAMQSAS